MTLCVAAVCDAVEGKDPKIVLCADLQREEEGIGGSETEDKIGYIRKGWPALIAGTIHRGNDLLNVYAEYLAEHFSDITEFNLINHLREPVQIQKKRLADAYLRQTYTFNSDYLYGKGAASLPEALRTKMSEEVSKIKLGASLIVAGFMAETMFDDDSKELVPFLCLVDDTAASPDDVRMESDVACIGSGNFAAATSLYRREQNSMDSLEKTLYNVYEANRLSEEVPGVGKNFLSMNILHQDGKMKELTDAGYSHLRRMYARYGPREISNEKALALKPEFIEP